MTTWQRHLREASGWLDLGMIAEAAAAIEEIDPEDKMRPDVIGFRVSLYMQADKWEAGYIVARRMTTLEPHIAKWWHCLAICARYWQGVPEAEKITREAVRLFPGYVDPLFNLACLLSVQGQLPEAKACLEEVFELDKDMRLLAIDCEDLKPVWDHIARE